MSPNEITADGHRATAVIVAFKLGTCHGRPAYNAVQWFFPEYGDHFNAHEAGYKLCTGYVSESTECHLLRYQFRRSILRPGIAEAVQGPYLHAVVGKRRATVEYGRDWRVLSTSWILLLGQESCSRMRSASGGQSRTRRR